MILEWAFVFDVLLNFITSYRNSNGIVITELNYICVNYLQSWFLLDAISSIPTDNLA